MPEDKVAELDKRLSIVEEKIETQGKKICKAVEALDVAKGVLIELSTTAGFEKEEIKEIKETIKETNKDVTKVKLKQIAIAAAAGVGGSGVLTGLLKLFS